MYIQPIKFFDLFIIIYYLYILLHTLIYNYFILKMALPILKKKKIILNTLT